MRGPSETPDAGDSNMQNDLMACDGPTTANAAPSGRGRSSLRRTMRRGLLALPLALALIAGGATTALAAEPTSGYSHSTPAPTTTTASPKGEAAPTNTSGTASKETPSSSTEPTATTAAKATTLPFTGLDLRWVILAGVLLVGMGASIVVVQRGRQGTGR
jgi:hypothetical protein